MDLSYKIFSHVLEKYEGTTYNYHAIHYISDNNDKKTRAWKWYDRFFRKEKQVVTDRLPLKVGIRSLTPDTRISRQSGLSENERSIHQLSCS